MSEIDWAEAYSDFSIAWYWALVFVCIVLIAGLRNGLCEDLHKRHWLYNRINRFTLGGVLLVLGVLINASTWGLNQTAADLGWPAIECISRDVAHAFRAVSRPLGTIGAVLMVASLSDYKREWVYVVVATTIIFISSWVLVATA